jgi:AcrR family transcriptional regulator
MVERKRPNRPARPSGPPRMRRTAEEARRVILDAAEKRLREGGPEAIRLQDVAGDVGISHPTILHHFASRDGLVQALQHRAMERLEQELFEVLERGSASEGTALDAIERVSATLSDAGHARLLAWRILASAGPDAEDRSELMLRELVELVHARRTEYRREHGMPPPAREDAEFTVRLTAAAMLGDGIFDPFFDCWTGHADDPDVRRRFRTWFARLLLDHLVR